MKLYMFEGTPDEISKVMKQIGPGVGEGLGGSSPLVERTDKVTKPPLPLGNVKPGENYEEKEFVSVRFARQALTRIELSEPFRAVLIALRDANPEWVSAADLYKASGYEGQRFAGLMGAFGRRMKHTNGYDEDAHFFDFDWDDNAGAWRYRLPETVLEAMRLEGIG